MKTHLSISRAMKRPRPAPPAFSSGARANFSKTKARSSCGTPGPVSSTSKGFDTRLGRGTPLNGAEEIHAFTSLVARGHKLAYAPRAVVRHPCRATKQDLRARYLADLRAGVGYATLLFFEEPRYRRAVLAFKLRSLIRRVRNSEGEARWGEKGAGDYARTLSARLSGPWLYLRSRLKGFS